MSEKYISDEEFDALSEEEQVQTLIDMVKGVPREDLPLLMKTFKEISRNQGMLKGKESGIDCEWAVAMSQENRFYNIALGCMSLNIRE